MEPSIKGLPGGGIDYSTMLPPMQRTIKDLGILYPYLDPFERIEFCIAAAQKIGSNQWWDIHMLIVQNMEKK